MGSRIGTTKVAAKKLGLSLAEYQAKLDANLKWCTRCKRWFTLVAFPGDVTRYDGLAARCRDCHRTGNTSQPSRYERLQKATQGLKWCSKCSSWLPVGSVRGGVCKICVNRIRKERYVNDAKYRAKTKQLVIARKRGVAPILPDFQKSLLEDFENQCAYCGGVPDSWDHIVPVSKGGKTVEWNIVPVCRCCNSSKNNRDVIEWINAKGLNPCWQFWELVAGWIEP